MIVTPTLRIPVFGFSLEIDSIGDVPVRSLTGLLQQREGRIVVVCERALNLLDKSVYEWWRSSRAEPSLTLTMSGIVDSAVAKPSAEKRNGKLLFQKAGGPVGELPLVDVRIDAWGISACDARVTDENMVEAFTLSIGDLDMWTVLKPPTV